MAKRTAPPGSLREALGRPDEGLAERVASRLHPGDSVNRGRRLVATHAGPSDDELATVLIGWMLRRR